MTLPAARDLAVACIRCDGHRPRIARHPVAEGVNDEASETANWSWVRSVNFPKRLGNPAEFGELVAHIASNSYLNAEVIRLDGGIRMPPK